MNLLRQSNETLLTPLICVHTVTNRDSWTFLLINDLRQNRNHTSWSSYTINPFETQSSKNIKMGVMCAQLSNVLNLNKEPKVLMNIVS